MDLGGRHRRTRTGISLKPARSPWRWPASAAVLLIKIYQKLVSPGLSPKCRFQPSCSQYAVDSIQRFGLLRGSWLGMSRISRCHPLHPGGFDPVPDSWKVR